MYMYFKQLFAPLVGLNPAVAWSAAKLQSWLLTLTLMVAALRVSSAIAAEKKMVKDSSTGKMVTAPEYGGTFTYATVLEPPHTDPRTSYVTGLVIALTAERLGFVNWAADRDEYTFSSQFIPLEVAAGQLAESLETPDATTIVFHIRQGVRWHNKAPMNGRELTAEDVEFNYHRMLGLGSGFSEPIMGGALASIPFESVTATDGSTVVFKLKEPSPLPCIRSS